MLQFAGFWMALATFLGIWWGHVGVRWLEAHSVRLGPPMAVLIILGLGLNTFSLFSDNLTAAGVASIIGITLLWDALELHRQAKRIAHGHAPANLSNPRHSQILATSPLATTEDLLNREPQGFPITAGVPHKEAPRTVEVADYSEVQV